MTSLCRARKKGNWRAAASPPRPPRGGHGCQTMASVDTPRGDAWQAVGTSKSRFAIISGISRSTLQQHLRQADRSLGA